MIPVGPFQFRVFYDSVTGISLSLKRWYKYSLSQMKLCYIWCLVLGCMNRNKGNLDLGILKHQPGNIHEEYGLLEYIPGLLTLPA